MGFQVTHHDHPVGPVHATYEEARLFRGQTLRGKGWRAGSTTAWKIVAVDADPPADAPPQEP